MTLATLPASDTANVELAYLDSGAPEGSSDYTTIFAIHGMIFTNLIFDKLLAVAPKRGVRVVAIQRRPFAGSTAFGAEELNITLTGGTEAERAVYAETRGHELAIFIDNFISKFKLPVISGSKGGAILLGWSVGGVLPVLAIGHSNTLPGDVKDRLGAHIRSLIIYESAPMCFGLPMPAQNFSPLVDEAVPQNKRLQLFGQWCTGYFDHTDFSLKTPHDHDLLEWVLHTPANVPTLYNIPLDKLSEIASYGDDASTDLPLLYFFQNEHKKALASVLKDKEIEKLFPNLKRAYLTGSKAPAFGIAGMWAIQDDKDLAGAPVEYKIAEGGNHFMIWDAPGKLLDAILTLA